MDLYKSISSALIVVLLLVPPKRVGFCGVRVQAKRQQTQHEHRKGHECDDAPIVVERRVRVGLRGLVHVHAEPCLGGGQLRTLEGPVDWSSCHVRTVGGNGRVEPEEEPDLEDRVYLNVAIYNQGRRSRCLPAGVPVVSLRGSGKKEKYKFKVRHSLGIDCLD